jgi:hypothetical protein
MFLTKLLRKKRPFLEEQFFCTVLQLRPPSMPDISLGENSLAHPNIADAF